MLTKYFNKKERESKAEYQPLMQALFPGILSLEQLSDILELPVSQEIKKVSWDGKACPIEVMGLTTPICLLVNDAL